jgi:hypothetical protein
MHDDVSGGRLGLRLWRYSGRSPRHAGAQAKPERRCDGGSWCGASEDMDGTVSRVPGTQKAAVVMRKPLPPDRRTPKRYCPANPIGRIPRNSPGWVQLPHRQLGLQRPAGELVGPNSLTFSKGPIERRAMRKSGRSFLVRIAGPIGAIDAGIARGAGDGAEPRPLASASLRYRRSVTFASASASPRAM